MWLGTVWWLLAVPNAHTKEDTLSSSAYLSKPPIAPDASLATLAGHANAENNRIRYLFRNTQTTLRVNSAISDPEVVSRPTGPFQKLFNFVTPVQCGNHHSPASSSLAHRSHPKPRGLECELYRIFEIHSVSQSDYFPRIPSCMHPKGQPRCLANHVAMPHEIWPLSNIQKHTLAILPSRINASCHFVGAYAVMAFCCLGVAPTNDGVRCGEKIFKEIP